MARRRNAKIGASLKQYAKDREADKAVPAPETAPLFTGSLTKSKALKMARDRARSVRAYVSSQDYGATHRVHHLVGLVKEWVGPTFDNIQAALTFARALNELGEERLIQADGVKIGDWRKPMGKRWVPNAKERRAEAAKAAA